MILLGLLLPSSDILTFPPSIYISSWHVLSLVVNKGARKYFSPEQSYYHHGKSTAVTCRSGVHVKCEKISDLVILMGLQSKEGGLHGRHSL